MNLLLKTTRPISKERFEEIIQHAIGLVEDGHSEGSIIFELLDEIDRIKKRPLTSLKCSSERGWLRE